MTDEIAEREWLEGLRPGDPRNAAAPSRSLLAVVLIRQLHSRRDLPELQMAVCAECRQKWPCQTEQTIVQALNVPNVEPPF